MLCVRFPFPPKDGGSIAMFNLIETLYEQGHDVTVMAMNTPKHYVHVRNLPDEVLKLAEFHAVDIDTTPSSIDALANLLFSKTSYHVERFDSKGFRTALEGLLKERTFDIIQIETLYLSAYLNTIRKHQEQAIVLLRAHNIEHEIWERKASNEPSPIRKYYFDITAERIRAYETGIFKDASLDAILPVSQRDEKKIKKIGTSLPVKTINIGINMDRIYELENEEGTPIAASDTKCSLFYIGALDWMPNSEGLDWFLKKVWPTIEARYPQAQLNIAGRNMPTRYRFTRQSNINVAGEVENAYRFMTENDIMIVPLFTGSGMRVKIVEGMVLKRPIVATSIAVEGIDPVHGKHAFIGDDAQGFVKYISILIEKPEMRKLLGSQARELIEQKFDNKKIGKDLVDFYQSLKASKEKNK